MNLKYAHHRRQRFFSGDIIVEITPHFKKCIRKISEMNKEGNRKAVNSLPKGEEVGWIYSDIDEGVRFRPMESETKVVGGRLQQLQGANNNQNDSKKK